MHRCPFSPQQNLTAKQKRTQPRNPCPLRGPSQRLWHGEPRTPISNPCKIWTATISNRSSGVPKVQSPPVQIRFEKQLHSMHTVSDPGRCALSCRPTYCKIIKYAASERNFPSPHQKRLIKDINYQGIWKRWNWYCNLWTAMLKKLLQCRCDAISWRIA